MEEAFHFKHGEDMVLTLMSGTAKQMQMGQEAFDRWWGPSLAFFGPNDRPDERVRPAMKWRMKTATNDELRQKFVNRFAPAAIATGLVINVCTKDEAGLVTSATPDPLLKLDEESGNWNFTQPAWICSFVGLFCVNTSQIGKLSTSGKDRSPVCFGGLIRGDVITKSFCYSLLCRSRLRGEPIRLVHTRIVEGRCDPCCKVRCRG